MNNQQKLSAQSKLTSSNGIASTGKPKKNIPGGHFEEPASAIRQFSDYTEDCQPVPDNNPFWENGHNPLSSKGN